MIYLTVLLLSVSSVFCSTIPIHYDITIVPDYNNARFNTETTITFFVEPATNVFSLNVRNLQVQEVTISAAGEAVTGFTHSVNEAEETLLITLESPTTHDLYEIVVHTSGEITENYGGLYWFKHNRTGDSEGEESTILLADLRYDKARQVFPCVDDPLVPSTFTLSVVRPNAYRSISNMAPTSSVDYDASHKIDVFAKTDTMPTYLLSFVVCEHVNVNAENSNVLTCTQNVNNTLEMAQFSKEALENFGEMYPFRFDKVDHVIVPDSALSRDALESVGLVIYRESSFYFDAERDSVEDKQELVKIVAHSVATQSKKYETNFQWSPSWYISEGLISLYQYEVLSELQSVAAWNLLDQFLVDQLEEILQNDEGDNPISVILPNAQTPDDFTDLQVAKSLALVRMFSAFPTPEIIQDHETNPSALSWIQNPGYPILTVTREENNDEFHFNQNGSLVRHIPINMFFEDDLYNNDKFTDVVDTENLSINFTEHLSSSWYIVNRQRLGYYRANYEPRNWDSLISFLTNPAADINEIPPATRGILIEDAFYHASTDRLNFTVYFDLIQYLRREHDYAPLYAFVKTAHLMTSLLTNTTVQARFMKMSVDVLEHIYNTTAEDHLTTLRRSKIATFLCSFGLEQCQQESHEALQRGEPAHPDSHELIYCGGMRRGTIANFHFLGTQYVLHNKKRILRSMGCTSDDEILRYYLAAILDSSELLQLKQEDKIDAFLAVLEGSEVGVEVALDFAKQYLEQILQSFSAGEVETMFIALSKRLVTDEHTEKINAIIECLTDVQKVEFETLFATVQSNILSNKQWQSSYSSTIGEWLDTYETTTPGPTVSPPTVSEPTPDPSTDPPPGGAADLQFSLTLLTFVFSSFILLHN